METKPTLSAFKGYCPEVDEYLIDMHLHRLPNRYFEYFKIKEIAEHIRILNSLSPANPLVIDAHHVNHEKICCTVLTFNYSSLFSIITGVFSSIGFNIKDGSIFTYASLHTKKSGHNSKGVDQNFPQPPHSSSQRGIAERRKVVDCFYGRINDMENLEPWLELAQSRLEQVVSLLEEGNQELSRQRVHEWVIQGFTANEVKTFPILYPVHMELDNSAPDLTLLKVTSEDTHAFLYSLSTALSLQKISIERVNITTSENRIQDEIWLADKFGKKIKNQDTLDRIKFTTLFTKQFTYFLSYSPDPATALTRFDHLINDVFKMPEKDRWVKLLDNPRYLGDLAHVLGTSDFMWEDFIHLQHEMLIPILEPHVKDHRFFDALTIHDRLQSCLSQVASYEEKCEKLNEFKDREIFLIDLDHILNLQPGHGATRYLGDNLTLLAEHIIRAATNLIYENLVHQYGEPKTVGQLPTRFALFGLGKFGGEALGYASDIELILVYRDIGRTTGDNSLSNTEFFELFMQELIHCIRSKREGIMTIDLQLRPYGNDGPLACSMESFCRYYGQGGPAHSYERLALVRLRTVAGDQGFGKQIERLRDEYIYSPRSINIQEIHEIRAKQYAEKAGGIYPNVKFSPGALVDLEYDVQILQVLYGKDMPALKTPLISEALRALSDFGILSAKEKESLINAYYFLRRLINGLRMLRGNAKDLFLPPLDSDEFVHLARRIGYSGERDLEPQAQLYMEFATKTASVRAFVEKHFGRSSLPNHSIGNVADLVIYQDVPNVVQIKILTKAGFKNTHRAYTNLQKLSDASSNRDEFASLAVLGFDFIKRKADPDMVLNNWERFVTSLPHPEGHFTILMAQPKRLDILFSIFSSSQFLADTLINNPDFFDWVTSPEILNRRYNSQMLNTELNYLTNEKFELSEWMDEIRRFRQREVLRIATRDMILAKPIIEITHDLSCLADALIQTTLKKIKQELSDQKQNLDNFALLALGKLGGMELNYSSDIDLLGFYQGSHKIIYNQVMEKIKELLATHTNAGYIYRVDYRLRPYGVAGELIYSRRSLLDYYSNRASLMEIQSLLKARPVGGNLALGQSFLKDIRPILVKSRNREDIVTSIEKFRLTAIKNSAKHLTTTMDIKNGMGGIRDIEFLIQGLQLMHVSEVADLLGGNTLKILKKMGMHNKIDLRVGTQLSRDYIFLRRIEHFLQLMEDQQTHNLPADPESLEALAKRVLGDRANQNVFMEKLNDCIQRVHKTYRRLLSL